MSLISTYDLRVWMGIPSGDTKPNAKLDYISRAIQDFCDSYTNRQLEAKRYLTDPYFSYSDGQGLPYMYAPQYPVSYVSSVNVDNNRDFGSGTLITSTDIFWYPNGKIVSEGGYFLRGRRNVLIDYTAGFAPVVGNTHDNAVSTYPVPLDLKQTMVEMCVESFKEGMTGVHTVEGGAEGEPKFIQMLSRNSFWRNVLNKFKAFDKSMGETDEHQYRSSGISW